MCLRLAVLIQTYAAKGLENGDQIANYRSSWSDFSDRGRFKDFSE